MRTVDFSTRGVLVAEQPHRSTVTRRRSRDAFITHWNSKVLGNAAVTVKTVMCDGEIAGNIVCYKDADKRLVGYWIGKSFWGQGTATEAVSQFTAQRQTRPLHAFVAKQNLGSTRVLCKCGFSLVGEPMGCHDGDEVPVSVYALLS